MKRTIQKLENGRKLARIVYCNEWEEYSVKFYDNKEYLKGADYFASDKDDALDTANYFINN